MILFNRLNGQSVAINPDLIERVEATPDTVITLVDDKKFLVAETLEQVLDLIVDYRAVVIARSTNLTIEDDPRPTLYVVPNEIVVSPHQPSDDALVDDAAVDLPTVLVPKTSDDKETGPWTP